MFRGTSRLGFDGGGNLIREVFNAIYGAIDGEGFADARGVHFENLHHDGFSGGELEVVDVVRAKPYVHCLFSFKWSELEGFLHLLLASWSKLEGVVRLLLVLTKYSPVV